MINLYCTGCGNRFQSSDSFCYTCGISRDKIGELLANDFCSECGKQLHENEKFCGTCGRRTGIKPTITHDESFERAENLRKLRNKYNSLPFKILRAGLFFFSYVLWENIVGFLIYIGILLVIEAYIRSDMSKNHIKLDKDLYYSFIGKILLIIIIVISTILILLVNIVGFLIYLGILFVLYNYIENKRLYPKVVKEKNRD